MKNKFGNYDLYNVSIWLGSAALILSGVVMMATKTMSDLLAVILLLGIMALMINFFAYVGMDKKSQDERLRKIGTYATTYSWYITLVFVSFLVISMYWAQNIHNPIELMGVIILVMTSTMLIANTILSRKGDID
jgi:NADH:ubiquinone oxidoreductase subunit 6 (subunit J)